MKVYAQNNTEEFLNMIKNLLNVLFSKKKSELKTEVKKKLLRKTGNMDDYLYLVETMQNNLDLLRCVRWTGILLIVRDTPRHCSLSKLQRNNFRTKSRSLQK